MKTFLRRVSAFAAAHAAIEALLIVGSYAWGAARADSDLDLVLITPDKADFVLHDDFVRRFGAVRKKQTEYYGACTSVRVWYQNGPEVEFGIVEPGWIKKPLDEGTKRVLQDGYRVLVDKKHYFETL